MFKNVLVAAAIAVAVTLGSASAFAQSYPQANQPVATPISQAHQMAELAGNPEACGPAVAKEWANPYLHIQQSGFPARNDVAKQLLLAAKNFAANGDEMLCWHWYDRFQQSR